MSDGIRLARSIAIKGRPGTVLLEITASLPGDFEGRLPAEVLRIGIHQDDCRDIAARLLMMANELDNPDAAAH